MSERHAYPAGVPCWTDVLVPDPAAVEDFYGDVFGWDFDPTENGYRVARIRGLDVVGLGQATQPMPSWNTYIRVESAAAAAERAAEDGGTVLIEPFDVLPAGRIAVIADPTQAVFAVWEAVEREGAALEGRGRVLVRASGTEPLVRVMVEAPSEAECDEVCARLVGVVEAKLA
jgi:predicted enzyme related to lactoylglutathione lyase